MSSSVVTLREDELAHASRSSSTAHESLLKSARSTKITSNSHLEQMKGGGWCTAATWAAAATAERAWRRHGKASKDGDADLCSCGLAANHRVGIRRRLRLERLILPGRPARCQSEAHAEATAELLAPTWSGSALHAKIPKMDVTTKVFRAYSYYSRTGGNDDDERPINGHTAAHPATASELCINGNVACGRKITWGPGLRACKGPLIRGRPMSLLPPGIPHAAVPWR